MNRLKISVNFSTKEIVYGLIILLAVLIFSLIFSTYSFLPIAYGSYVPTCYGDNRKISIDQENDRIYITGENLKAVFIRDANDGSLIHKIDEIPMPQAVAINPITNTIYVAASNLSWARVYVLNGTSYEIIKYIEMETESQTANVLVNLQTNFIYVTNPNKHTISIIDGSTNEIVTSIKDGYEPHYLGMNPNTNEVYFLISDLKSYKGPRIDEMSRDESIDIIFQILNEYDLIDVISVIDGKINELDRRLYERSHSLSGIIVNSKTNLLYTSAVIENNLIVIDPKTGNEVASVQNVTNSPHGVVIDENSNTIFVAGCDDFTAVVDGHTNQVVEKIDPQSTKGMAFHYNSGNLYGYDRTGEVFVLFTRDQTDFIIMSPYQQTKNGIMPEDIVCTEDLQLIFKYDNSPACVKPSTAEKLMERGWISCYQSPMNCLKTCHQNTC